MSNVQILDNELYKNISEYCKLNKIKINRYITDLLQKYHMIEVYGDVPFGSFETSNFEKTNENIQEIINIPEEKEETIIKEDIKVEEPVIKDIINVKPKKRRL